MTGKRGVSTAQVLFTDTTSATGVDRVVARQPAQRCTSEAMLVTALAVAFVVIAAWQACVVHTTVSLVLGECRCVDLRNADAHGLCTPHDAREREVPAVLTAHTRTALVALCTTRASALAVRFERLYDAGGGGGVRHANCTASAHAESADGLPHWTVLTPHDTKHRTWICMP